MRNAPKAATGLVAAQVALKVAFPTLVVLGALVIAYHAANAIAWAQVVLSVVVVIIDGHYLFS